MADKPAKEPYDWHEYEEWHMKNWRAWGSWFSWGSPVGLSIFFLTLTGCVWVLFHLK